MASGNFEKTRPESLGIFITLWQPCWNKLYFYLYFLVLLGCLFYFTPCSEISLTMPLVISWDKCNVLVFSVVLSERVFHNETCSFLLLFFEDHKMFFTSPYYLLRLDFLSVHFRFIFENMQQICKHESSFQLTYCWDQITVIISYS